VTTPELLQAAGIALFAMAAVLAILCVRMFVRQDIKGVYDDLAGRSRQRGIDQVMHARARSKAHEPRTDNAVTQEPEDYETRLVPRLPSKSEQTVVVTHDMPLTTASQYNVKGGE